MHHLVWEEDWHNIQAKFIRNYPLQVITTSRHLLEHSSVKIKSALSAFRRTEVDYQSRDDSSHPTFTYFGLNKLIE